MTAELIWKVKSIIVPERATSVRRGFEHVVPVVEGRAQTLDGGIAMDHSVGHAVAGGIGIEGAEDWPVAGDN